MTVDTSLSAGTTVTLPLRGNVAIEIDWGDGATTSVTNANQLSNVEHTYSSEGTYSITITGTLEQFGAGSTYNNADKITSVTSWGDLGITSLAGAFRNASNTTSLPNSLPAGVTDLREMFYGASLFNADISNWDTSSVTDMHAMFNEAGDFNQDISSWDTSSVTDMGYMFRLAYAFNQPLNSWDTSQVTLTDWMFHVATDFNQDISAWDTSKVTDMTGMFSFGATSFNQDLSPWCVSLIGSAPSDFDTDASAWTGAPGTRPQWGTCPTFLPEVTTGAATNIATSSATLQATLTYRGNATTTDRGFIYSTDNTFATGVATSTESGDFALGSYSQIITGLSTSTTYYYRAFATNAEGTGYGATGTTTTQAAAAGTLTLQDHLGGQVSNIFSFQNQTDETLFAFALAATDESSLVTELAFSLESMVDIEEENLPDIRLYFDEDEDQMLSVGDTQVGGTPVWTQSGSAATLTFPGDFTVAGTQQIIAVTDTYAISSNARATVNLLTGGITATGVSSAAEIVTSGTATAVTHSRTTPRGGGGGGGGSRLLGPAPEGAGDETGGSGDGGGALGEEVPGEELVITTGYYAPTSTGGPHNEWVNGANAYVTDNSDATSTTIGDRQSFATFNFNVPDSNTIVGIEVKIEAAVTGSTGSIQVGLSSDSGASVTSLKTLPITGGTDTVYTTGGSSDMWGRTWTPTNVNNENFRLRLIAQPAAEATLSVDAITVRIYHNATGGGGGGGGAL